MDKRIGAVARAVGYQEECRACEVIAASWTRVRELLARLPDRREAGPLASFTARSFCAWCGRVEVTEQRATPDGIGDLRAVWEGVNAGRMCAPEVAAAYDRIGASLRASLGGLAAEYDELVREMSAALADLPPPRFPYACAVAGCGCSYQKRAAA